MKYQELILLLPCHSLEDFPTHHEGDDAEGLLAAWSAMWHPALLAAAGKAPSWYRVDDPPEELAERLLVIPAASYAELPTGFAQRARAAGATLIRREPSRERIVAEALAELEGGDRGVPADLVADFLALGYCHLQVELLTRQMRYSSNLDEVHFHNEALAGAAAAVAGDETHAREKLTACFDLLAEERDHYYSVDCFVVDLILGAASALGASLRAELGQSTPINVLLSGELWSGWRWRNRRPWNCCARCSAASERHWRGARHASCGPPCWRRKPCWPTSAPGWRPTSGCWATARAPTGGGDSG